MSAHQNTNTTQITQTLNITGVAVVGVEAALEVVAALADTVAVRRLVAEHAVVLDRVAVGLNGKQSVGAKGNAGKGLARTAQSGSSDRLDG